MFGHSSYCLLLMAVQFSRPDPSSPNAIAAATFSTVRRGFDPNEVRGLLRTVSGELTRLQDRERQLEREVAALKQAQIAPTLPLDEETLTSMLGEETARVIATAREAALSIRTRAEEGATRLLRDAAEEAATTRSQAELEAAKRLQEAQIEAQMHLEAARAQGRDMANEAREYRERVLADVGRRRELARMQLLQVNSGRERLMQAFERARLVAVDVLVEVDELGGEPEELVNLALTTGPVPVMVPRPSVASSTLPALTPNPKPVDTAPKSSAAAAANDAAPVRGEAPEQADAGVSSSVAMYNATDEDEDGVVPNADEVATDPDAATGTDDLDDQAGTTDTGTDTDGDMSLVDDSTVEEVTGDDSTVDDSTVEAVTVDEVTVDDSTVEAVTVDEVTVDDSTVEAVTVEDHGPLASVVSLFAGELDSRSADRTQSQSRVAVDQLFAKLKVAKAEEIARDVEQSVAAPTSIRQAPKKRPATDSSHDAREVPVGAAGPEDVSVFEHRDELLAGLTASVARKLKRVLADEQNEVLDVLRRKEPVSDLDTLVPLEPEHARSYAQVIHDDLYTAATGGAMFSDPAGDPQRRIADAGIIDTLLAEVEEAVVQPLRERLYAAVAAQSSNDKLGQTVRGIYREWKTSVLDIAAADLAASAYARGVSAVLVPGTAVSWIISPASPACGECSTNAAAGVVQFGDAFPTGDLSSPAHLGCRCLIVAAGRP